MQPAVVSIGLPAGIEAVGYVGFCAPVLDVARVHVLSLGRIHLNDVLSVDVIEVESIRQGTVEEALCVSQFVADEAFGLQVGVF